MFMSIVPRPDTPEYCYHQYLWTYFDKKDQPDAPRPFIYRVFDNSLLMLSREHPACPHQDIGERIKSGQVYQFDLIANPARGTRRDENGGRHRREAYKTNSERIDWLKRRLGDSAELRFAQVFDRPRRRFKKGDGHQVIIDECSLRGTIYVNDRANFIETVQGGVGGRGCWGCGLLVLPEVMQWTH